LAHVLKTFIVLLSILMDGTETMLLSRSDCMPEVSQEDFDLLANYPKLGTVEAISGTLAGFQQMARTNTVNEAAKICGFKPQVLDKLSGGLELSVKDNNAFVKTKDGEVALGTYAESEWKDFMPSLKAEVQTQQQQVAFIPQPVKGIDSKPTGVKLVKNYITRTYGQQQSTVNGGN